ncbi:MAG TPA: YdeI/OmpD-associated family protein [Terriglobales bacterium]|nr:YdeI/OmpD-associated family protein [Terriglobales bacterium]
MDRSTAKSFKATLEHNKSRLNWVIVRIPFDVYKVWKERGMLKVKGEINGFAFRTSLFPTGDGGHTLLVNKRMQAGAKVKLGNVAQFRLEPDTEERTVTIPIELKKVLSEDRSLSRWFDRLNYSTRKYIVDWITDVKSTEARERRSEQIAERLLATMEAERELPPILQVEFSRNRLAYEGWLYMSLAHRRQHLLGIFYYRNPESRARRIAKMIEEVEQLAKKRTKKADVSLEF